MKLIQNSKFHAALVCAIAGLAFSSCKPSKTPEEKKAFVESMRIRHAAEDESRIYWNSVRDEIFSN